MGEKKRLLPASLEVWGIGGKEGRREGIPNPYPIPFKNRRLDITRGGKKIEKSIPFVVKKRKKRKKKQSGVHS